jgi:hypothetical protein
MCKIATMHTHFLLLLACVSITVDTSGTKRISVAWERQISSQKQNSNLHSLQIIKTHSKSSLSTMSSLVQVQVSQSHVTTDDQSVSKSWFRGPSGSHDLILISV